MQSIAWPLILVCSLMSCSQSAPPPETKDAEAPYDATTKKTDPDPIDWCDPCFVEAAGVGYQPSSSGAPYVGPATKQ